ncbi:peptidase associated/transthyretin-like domain-containing protein [Rubripirellula amarantea]|nr:carboxypeptidase-like regulatory domain-containing protein [Rubripirellula amarantea]
MPMFVMTLAVLTIGCGSPKRNGDYVKITGTVHVDGAPAEGVVVRLYSDSQGTSLSNGVSGPDGRLTISTHELGDGALPGRYEVTCTWSDFDPLSRSWTGDQLEGRYATKGESGIVWDVDAEDSFDAGILDLRNPAAK